MIEEFIYTWRLFHGNKQERQHKYIIEYNIDTYTVTEISMTSDEKEECRFTKEFDSEIVFDIYLKECRKSGAKFQETGTL